MGYHSKWSDRRKASAVKPLIYLMVEVIIMVSLCWFVSFLDILIVTILVSLGAIYFFVTSALPRYKKVKKRQKFSKH